MLKNTDIRKYSKERGVKLYEVAEIMNKSQSYLTRKLYFELPDGEKQEMFKIIDELAAKKQAQEKNAVD